MVFDLGNVMVEWDRDRLFRSVIPDRGRRDEFFATIATMDWNLELDRGLPFEDAVTQLTARHPGWAAEIAAYRDRWQEMLGPVDDEAVELLSDLVAGGVRTIGLTNWSAETFPIAEERFPFLAFFEGIVVSGREGLVKPDPAIFDLVCSRFLLDPAQLLFTDDSISNVSGARAAGWDAVLWTGAVAFREELVLRDVL